MKRAHIDTLLCMELLVDTVQKLSMATNIEAVMQIVKGIARELTKADGATFVLREGDLCYYADEEAISPLWKGSRFPMSACISGWVMETGQSVSIPDIFKDSRIPIEAYRPTFVKSLVMVPIRSTSPIGAIGTYWSEYNRPGPEELSLLKSLGDITAVSIENISVHNRLKRQLEERDKMLQQLSKQKQQLEEFTQIISHNLRAPLSNLLLLGDMVERTSSIEEKLIYIEKQKPVIDFLHEIFEELVNATQVRMDFSVEKENIDLEAVFLKVMGLLQGEIIQLNAEITYDVAVVTNIHYPHKYIESILFNLVSNALKYHHPDRIPRIHFSAYKRDDWVVLQLSDNGLGIDLEKHRSSVFKLRKTFHKHPKAKGFGLFITKTEIESMGGEITVNSEVGKGCVFSIKLIKS